MADEGLGSRIDRLQKRLPPIAFGYAVIKKYLEDGGGRLASTIAYYAFFSVFPALLVLVAVTGFVLQGNPGLQDQIVDTAVSQFPVIGDEIADASLQGSGLALVLGLAGAVWAGLGAMLAVENAFNGVWDVPFHERSDPFRSRLRGLLMFAVIGLGVVVATALANIISLLGLPLVARVGSIVVNIGINTALAYLAFQILTAKRVSWTDLWPGAVLTGIVFWLLQTAGGIVVGRYVSTASDTYGTFALVIGLLTWFHLVSQATLLAAEVNVVRARRLYPRTMFGDDLTEGDERALVGHQQEAARHWSMAAPEDPLDRRPAGSRDGGGSG